MEQIQVADRKTVLVTGAAGYIGSVCCERLVERGYRVIGFDNLSEGEREAVIPEAEFVLGDIGDGERLQEVFSRHSVDAVMHFAAKAAIEESMRNPSAIYLNNVAGTLTLLDAMRAVGIKKLIFSSTAAVYGTPDIVPILEDHPHRPINPYGESKLAIERMLPWYRSAYGLQTAVFRYFNVAGATERCGEMRHTETHLIPLLMDAALGAIPVFKMFGTDYPTPDGTCVRDYVHVLDIVDAHMRALEQIDRVNGEAFNLGTGDGFSVKQMYDAACKITGKTIPLQVAARRPGDPATLVADSGKARKMLSWSPANSTMDRMFQSAFAWKAKLRAREDAAKEA
jgi:UDP-glucose 4-epimerase